MPTVIWIAAGLMFVATFAVTAFNGKSPSGAHALYALAAGFLLLFASHLVSDRSFIEQYGIYSVSGVLVLFAAAAFGGSWLADFTIRSRSNHERIK